MAKVTKNTFTAKVIIPNSEHPRYISNCIIFKGKLFQLISVGVGKAIEKGGMNSEGEGETWEEYSSYVDKMKPYLSKSLMGDKMNYFRELLNKSNNIITPENEEEILSVSFTMGENLGGYIVSDVDEDKRLLEAEQMKKVGNKEIPITIIDSHFGLTLSERLPANVWSKLKPYGKYWSADDIDEWFEDMDDFHKVGEGRDMKGWYYTKEIIEILKQLNFEIIEK